MDNHSAPEPGVRTRSVESVVSVILLMLGALVTFESQRLGSGWTTDGPGAGYFPFLIGMLLMVASAGILYQALSKKEDEPSVFVSTEKLKLVMTVLGPAALYVLAVQVLGIYVASAVYIALFMVLLGKYSWLKGITVAVAVNAFFFCMFEIWFKVPLHKGDAAPLSFLGY
jgi:hypothetical protein